MKTKTEKFIDKIKIKNNPKHFNEDGTLKYDYSKTNYTHSKTKIIIRCPIHGDFEQIPNSHLNGEGCYTCGKKVNTSSLQVFINKANTIHDNKFDYSKTNYKNSRTRVTVGCSVHGDFEVLPSSHLLGTGCSKCKNTFTTESFIDKATIKHNKYYSYDKSVYVSSSAKLIITCPKHGDFKQSVNSHLSGNGCSLCGGERISKSKTYSKDYFVDKANQVHSNKYNYTKTVYKASQTKILITCPKHGDFEQLPYSHLNGHGCLKCGSNGGGSINTFITNCIHNKKGKGIFYIIRCFNESESFYKIGITSRSVKARYKDKLAMPYDYEILTELIDDAVTIYNMEKYLLEKFENNSYEPSLYFRGITECFTNIEIN